MKIKEDILKEFDEKYPNTTLYQVKQFHIGTGHTERRNILISGDIKKFLSETIDKVQAQTREETIKEVGNSIKSFFYSLDDTNDEPFNKGIIQIDLDLVDKQIKDILNKLNK